MSEQKKAVRRNFKEAVFKRDGFQCRMCGYKPKPHFVEDELDAHHITPREEMPGGGYVEKNGITLCKGEGGTSCHELAEYVLKGAVIDGYSPEDLYRIIGSSKEQARGQAEEEDAT